MLSVPVGLRGARRHPRAGAVLAVLTAAVVAAVWFAVRVAAAQRAAQPTVVPGRTAVVSRNVPPGLAGTAGVAGVSAGGSEAPGGATSPAGSSTNGPAGARIIVHVVGEVARPGIVLLAQGARVIDAVTAAGGALASSDLERINLARVVTDGEQVHVPAPGEAILPGAYGSTLRAPAGGSEPAVRVNLNTAGLGELDSLPGVGPVLAQRIIDWRAQHGRFTSVEELGEISGIGARLLSQLTDRVTV